ncbi:hypothetical protein PHAVU_003G065300 [Phaseolus vulgaris]|uniref:Uncharacterized protein n=1 Tax=Phaseolus vulgaris TaxID=3885 RepID=V7C8V9_PHAVU|nr:hypothetical protein PHAVU_003G065300g [Phaseolus vulgaris]ESW25788.1 hypothetical protein PHAVU_003G065300g [Phaseolus vulgaris]
MGHNKPSKLMRDGLIIPCPEQIYEDVITVKVNCPSQIYWSGKWFTSNQPHHLYQTILPQETHRNWSINTIPCLNYCSV